MASSVESGCNRPPDEPLAAREPHKYTQTHVLLQRVLQRERRVGVERGQRRDDTRDDTRYRATRPCRITAHLGERGVCGLPCESRVAQETDKDRTRAPLPSARPAMTPTTTTATTVAVTDRPKLHVIVGEVGLRPVLFMEERNLWKGL